MIFIKFIIKMWTGEFMARPEIMFLSKEIFKKKNKSKIQLLKWHKIIRMRCMVLSRVVVLLRTS